VSIRQFFYEVLNAFGVQRESFNSKRPFGNSEWDYDVVVCLAKHNLIKGKWDKEGNLLNYSTKEYNKFVKTNILKPLFGVK